MELTVNQAPAARLPGLCRGIAALAAYAALWGCISSLGYLGSLGVLSLLPGACAALLAALPRGIWRRRVLWAVLALGLGLALWMGPSLAEGCKLYLNRLFAASEARQSYLYDRFSVSGGLDQISRAMLPLGLLTGLWFAWSAAPRLRGLALLPGTLLLFAWAYLGLLPETGWVLALGGSFAGLLVLLGPETALSRRLILLGGTVCLGALLLLGLRGSREALTPYADAARDRLALRTVAYGESPREEPTEAPQETRPYEIHRTERDRETPSESRLPLILGVILAALLLLFLPALWSDRLKARRAKNRRGLEDPDPSLRGKAAFLYGLRWLEEAGLATDNRPYSALTPSVSALDPDLGAAYEALIPLWQAAAYSPHPLPEPAADRLAAFAREARTLARSRLKLWQRLRADYILGL